MTQREPVREDRGVEALDVVALVPWLPPGVLEVVLQLDAERAVSYMP